ncbi:hypothetical protein [Paenibacillus chitinolyticus]|uniref:hypothetical protein n=1 Tax=Paenibacillus chitinolyticus TaxID=79263 RepID=UPI00366E2151
MLVQKFFQVCMRKEETFILKYGIRMTDGRYIKYSSVSGTLIKGLLSEAILLDSLEEAINIYFQACERYEPINCRERSKSLNIVNIQLSDDPFKSRKLLDKATILLRQIYRIEYRLSDGQQLNTTKEFKVNKVMNQNEMSQGDIKGRSYIKYDVVKQIATKELKRMKGSRQLEDLYGTSFEKDIERWSMERRGQFEITNIEFIENIII